jgi:hypothetical protein
MINFKCHGCLVCLSVGSGELLLIPRYIVLAPSKSILCTED